MAIKENLAGRKFGRLAVVDRNFTKKRTAWNCVCECGGESVVTTSKLLNGHTKSCGCLVSENAKRRFTKHGKSGTRLYAVYMTMIARCENPNNIVHGQYGGRGIRVCDRWRQSYENFIADMGYPENDKLTLERVNNAGNYEPGNVIWATRNQNARNKRNNAILEMFGRKQSVAAWAEELKVPYQKLRRYTRDYGLSLVDALACI